MDEEKNYNFFSLKTGFFLDELQNLVVFDKKKYYISKFCLYEAFFSQFSNIQVELKRRFLVKFAKMIVFKNIFLETELLAFLKSVFYNFLHFLFVKKNVSLLTPFQN